MSLKTFCDELGLGVKGQSNSVIVGSLRNALRSSLEEIFHEGKALNGLGAPPGYQTQSNSESHEMYLGSETVGDKLHCRKGNSPYLQLRSLNHGSVEKDVESRRQPGCWLRSSHHLKSA